MFFFIFRQIFTIFQSGVTEDMIEFWKIHKNGKILAKYKENPCPEIDGLVIR